MLMQIPPRRNNTSIDDNERMRVLIDEITITTLRLLLQSQLLEFSHVCWNNLDPAVSIERFGARLRGCRDRDAQSK